MFAARAMPKSIFYELVNHKWNDKTTNFKYYYTSKSKLFVYNINTLCTFVVALAVALCATTVCIVDKMRFPQPTLSRSL